VERQPIAATAFTAPVDALFVSLVGLDPGGNLRLTALALGLIGLTSSAGLTVRLWRSRRRAARYDDPGMGKPWPPASLHHSP
jgi:hypothetical protein